MNTSLSPDQRAGLVLKEMTLDEKIDLMHGQGMPGWARPMPKTYLGNRSGLHHRNTAAGHSAGGDERRGLRGQDERPEWPLLYGAAGEHRRGGKLGS